MWHLAPPSAPKPADRVCDNNGKVDWELAANEGVRHCVQAPGEVVVVPNGWWHATCNLQPYTVAVGGQTWDSAMAPCFVAAGAAPPPGGGGAKTTRGAPRELNRYQRALREQYVTEAVPMPPLESKRKRSRSEL